MTGFTRSLRALWVIFKQELSLYFVSPIVYLIGAVWLFLAGGFFSLSLNFMNQGMQPPNMQGMLMPMVFLMMFVAPALTMRLVADELRAGTHELLFTLPVRDWEIIVGKWLAVWAVYTIFVLVTLIFPFILTSRGNPDQGLIMTGYLGLWLFGAGALAVGVFASSLTQYQAISFMITMGILLFLWLSNSVAGIFNNADISSVLREVSLTDHYQSMVSRAVINPLDIVYFIGLIAIFLFLATQVLSTRRWSS